MINRLVWLIAIFFVTASSAMARTYDEAFKAQGPTACDEYVSCWYNQYDEAFGWGKVWKEKARCSFCSGESFLTTIPELLEKNYSIMSFQGDVSQGGIRFLLRRTEKVRILDINK